MEIKGKLKGIASHVGTFVAANPITSGVLVLGAAMTVYQAVTTPQGAVVALKGAAGLIGGLAVTALVTKGMVGWADEMDNMMTRGIEGAMQKAREFHKPELRTAGAAAT